MQSGAFFPWQGDPGYMLSLQLLGSGASARSRWGGEFEYRNFETRVAGVSGVDMESFILRGMWQQHFRPEAFVTPYVGLGLGVAINVVDDRKIDRNRGEDIRGSTGAGLDAIFMMGIRALIRGAEYMSVFAEGRVGVGFDMTGRNDEDGVEVEQIGGVSLNGGIRFRF